jgi:hypothetical protein
MACKVSTNHFECAGPCSLIARNPYFIRVLPNEIPDEPFEDLAHGEKKREGLYFSRAKLWRGTNQHQA